MASDSPFDEWEPQSLDAASRLDHLERLAAATTEYSPELLNMIQQERLIRTLRLSRLFDETLDTSDDRTWLTTNAASSLEHSYLPFASALPAAPSAWPAPTSPVVSISSLFRQNVSMLMSSAPPNPLLTAHIADSQRLQPDHQEHHHLGWVRRNYFADGDDHAACMLLRRYLASSDLNRAPTSAELQGFRVERPFAVRGTGLAVDRRRSASQPGYSSHMEPERSFRISSSQSDLAALSLSDDRQSQSRPPTKYESKGASLPGQCKPRRRYRTETFPRKLLRMLETTEHEGQQHLISYTEDGTAIRVPSPNKLTDEVFPKYFRHRNFASFLRQLSLYGFSRITNGVNKGAYAHPLFRKGQTELVNEIKRTSEQDLMEDDT